MAISCGLDTFGPRKQIAPTAAPVEANLLITYLSMINYRQLEPRLRRLERHGRSLRLWILQARLVTALGVG